jgi:hypothetical protein
MENDKPTTSKGYKARCMDNIVQNIHTYFRMGRRNDWKMLFYNTQVSIVVVSYHGR